MRGHVRLRGREGASAVEFVLIAPLLIVLLFSIVWFGIAFNRFQGMQAAAREAARLASVGATVAEVQARAPQALTSIEGPLDVVVVRLDAADPPAETVMGGAGQVACDELDPNAHSVRVTVTADPDLNAFSIPLFGAVRSSYEAEAVFRCE